MCLWAFSLLQSKTFPIPFPTSLGYCLFLRSASVGSRVQSAGLAAAASLAVGAVLLHPAAMPAPGSGVTWPLPCDSAALWAPCPSRARARSRVLPRWWCRFKLLALISVTTDEALDPELVSTIAATTSIEAMQTTKLRRKLVKLGKNVLWYSDWKIPPHKHQASTVLIALAKYIKIFMCVKSLLQIHSFFFFFGWWW